MWDDALVEWKNSRHVMKSEFEGCVAGFEFLFPRYRGKLGWCHAVIAGWNVVHVPKHTVPMTRRVAHFVAANFCSDGYSRLGFGVLLQRELGLRPSEVLGVLPTDCSLPEHSSTGGSANPRATIALGMRTGTKAKRAQAVTLRSKLLIGLLRWAIKTCPPGSNIVAFTYENYRRLLGKFQVKYGLQPLGLTPHSPRSGFATEAIEDGEDFVHVREAGRWLADTSLRTYIDVARVASIRADLQLAGLQPALDWTEANIVTFFAAAAPFLWEYNAGSRPEEGRGRHVLLPRVDEVTKDEPEQEEEAVRHSSPARGRGRGGGRGRR